MVCYHMDGDSGGLTAVSGVEAVGAGLRQHGTICISPIGFSRGFGHSDMAEVLNISKQCMLCDCNSHRHVL